MNTPKIGLGILSWRAHETIRKTLANYIEIRLFDLFDQSLIYFNDICDEDRTIADEAGIPYEGGPNSGIFGGMKALAHHLDRQPGFDRSAGPQRMAEVALQRADGNAFSEDPVRRLALRDVPDLRGRAVGVHVVDLVRA